MCRLRDTKATKAWGVGATWRSRAFRLTVCATELQQGKTKSDLDTFSPSLSINEELSMVFLVCLQLDWVSCLWAER